MENTFILNPQLKTNVPQSLVINSFKLTNSKSASSNFNFEITNVNPQKVSKINLDFTKRSIKLPKSIKQ